MTSPRLRRTLIHLLSSYDYPLSYADAEKLARRALASHQDEVAVLELQIRGLKRELGEVYLALRCFEKVERNEKTTL